MDEYNQPQIDISKFRKYIVIGVGLIFVLIFWNRITTTIQPGFAGLYYNVLSGGIDSDQTPYGQGLHFKWPWDRFVIYEVRQKERSEPLTVLSSNLLDISLDVTVFYQPVREKLGYLENERGQSYEERVIIPVVRSVAREVIAKYIPEEINTTKREIIEQEIFTVTQEKLLKNYVQLNEILIKNIKLPEKLRASIERKLQQEQESLEYEYKLQKEKKEAERKRIEAEGIQNFQRIVTQSITDRLLKWKGIEATETLAKSENAKVVVIGSGKDGLPLILGN